MFADALLDAEVRIGELLKEVPKGSGGDRVGTRSKINHGDNFAQPKGRVVKILYNITLKS